MAAYLVLCLALALFAAGGSAAPQSRIFGGEPTTINDYPFMIAYTYTYPGPGITIQRCVGGLLSSWHVLTTAFCFTGANNDNFRIRAGSTNSLSGGFVTSISHVVKHHDYQESPRIADLAITFVSQLIFLSPVINILRIPYENFPIEDGQETTVVGWGFDSDGVQLEQLKRITLHKTPLDECRVLYENDENVHIDESVICGGAPQVGMCAGDSGAPMVIDDVVVGIHTDFDACGSDEPDVFTRIDRYSNWILEVATPGRDGPKMVARN